LEAYIIMEVFFIDSVKRIQRTKNGYLLNFQPPKKDCIIGPNKDF